MSVVGSEGFSMLVGDAVLVRALSILMDLSCCQSLPGGIIDVLVLQNNLLFLFF